MQSFTDVWEKALKLIKPQVSEVSYDSWIHLLKPMKMENNTAYFYVRTAFQKGTVINNFKDIIEQAMTDTMGFKINLAIVTEDEAPPRIIEQAKVKEEKFNEVLEKNKAYILPTREDLTFENFVVGNENKFAHAAALAVANNPGSSYNPLFIYGRSGLGKTHLMCAIANEIKNNNPEATVLYIRCEEFVNELIEALSKNKMVEFRNKYRYVDAFLVDDVQFIAGKERTEEEFFHTFEALHEAKKQIVLTADRPASEMQSLADRLKTRFNMGLPADIQPPEFETRCAIIKRKAASLNLELSNDIVEFVAKKLHTNVRELEGAINKIKSFNMLFNEKPTLAIAQAAIATIISENMAAAISMEMIIDHVTRYYNVSVTDIKGNRRMANIVRARQISMYIARQMTEYSLEQIGEQIGGKDHTTVLHSINKVEKDVERDPRLSREVNEIMENIKKSF